MENEILEKISSQDEKLKQILESVEKTRKYFLWTLIITAITIILPLIALIFVVPFFLRAMSSALSL